MHFWMLCQPSWQLYIFTGLHMQAQTDRQHWGTYAMNCCDSFVFWLYWEMILSTLLDMSSVLIQLSRWCQLPTPSCYIFKTCTFVLFPLTAQHIEKYILNIHKTISLSSSPFLKTPLWSNACKNVTTCRQLMSQYLWLFCWSALTCACLSVCSGYFLS